MIKTGSLILFIFACGHLFSQSIHDATMVYMQTVGEQAPLYYGSLQEGRLRAINHPYFGSEQYSKARLSYRGIVYPEVMLRLDLNRDELVIFSPDGRQIVLFPEYVDYVELHGNRIIYFCNDGLPGSPSTGYYIVLHSGNSTILKKQIASRTEKTSQTGVERKFTFRTTFYLHKDGVYYTIRNKRGLLRALYPHKEKLRQFISSNRLNYRKNADELITRAVIEYEKLTSLRATP
ncbi:MAG: hypothetical protein LBH22_09935 [Bacteroidales bacterium]|jgi:hypothetical protein|nr:hypothetical protein [Bacteroidales bacterium]